MDVEYNIEFYRKFRRFVKIFMHTFYQIEANGIENIPKNSNALYIGNHLNILDSWTLLAIIDENLRFMVDQKLYRYKCWEKFFKTLGTFDINPNELDLKAIKTAITLLKEHESVVIFPEGKTHNRKDDVPFKPGIGKIACMGKTDIVPFGIRANYFPFSKITVNFGEPINLLESNIQKNEYDHHLEQNVRLLEKK